MSEQLEFKFYTDVELLDLIFHFAAQIDNEQQVYKREYLGEWDIEEPNGR